MVCHTLDSEFSGQLQVFLGSGQNSSYTKKHACMYQKNLNYSTSTDLGEFLYFYPRTLTSWVRIETVYISSLVLRVLVEIWINQLTLIWLIPRYFQCLSGLRPGAADRALLALCHGAHVTETLKLRFLICMEISIYGVCLIGSLEAQMR